MAGQTPESTEEPDGRPEPPGVSLRKLLEGILLEAKDFTRRKPLEGMLLSLIAGMVLSNLLRRGR